MGLPGIVTGVGRIPEVTFADASRPWSCGRQRSPQRLPSPQPPPALRVPGPSKTGEGLSAVSRSYSLLPAPRGEGPGMRGNRRLAIDFWTQPTFATGLANAGMSGYDARGAPLTAPGNDCSEEATGLEREAKYDCAC